MKSIRIQIRWPNGTQLPVRIPQSSYSSDLKSLLRFSIHKNRVMILLFNGHKLDSHQTLEDQGVMEDSIIQVAHLFRTTQSNKSDDYFQEILRIADLQFNIVEGHKNGGLILDSMMHESCAKDALKNNLNDNENELGMPTATVIDKTSAEDRQISTDPLPVLWDEENVTNSPLFSYNSYSIYRNNYEDEDESDFETQQSDFIKYKNAARTKNRRKFRRKPKK